MQPPGWLRWAGLVLLIGMEALAAFEFRVPALVHYGLLSLLVDDDDRNPLSVLRHHQVEIEAKPIPIPIPEIDRNLSGLTFSRYTNTLFGVINRPASVVEIDTDGQRLRTLPLNDQEGRLLVVSEPHLFYRFAAP